MIFVKNNKTLLSLDFACLIALFCFSSFKCYADATITKSMPITLDLKSFSQKGLYQDQKKFYPSLALEPSYTYSDDEKKENVKFKMWLRYDDVDKNGTYGDIRELSYGKVFSNDVEINLGVSKVFWGVTESVHLVDIINQNDEIEPARSNAKMGQPLISLALNKDWGSLKYFALPYFRERNFRGKQGRPWLGIDMKESKYQSSQQDRHIDHAVRYSKSLGGLDLGVSNFYGTSREPTFLIEIGNDRKISSITPFYQIINQTSIDLQYTKDALLLKAEAIKRNSKTESFFAGTYGFEYSFFDIKSSGADIGFLVEHTKDNRNFAKSPITIFQNDLFVGTRIALNDINDSEGLFGVYQDLDYGSKIYSAEFKKRLNEKLKLEIFANIYEAQNSKDFIYFQRRDNSFNARLSYYF